MRVLAPIAAILLLAACTAPETRRPGGDPDQYRSGYAAPGPVEPAEFAYDNPNASLRFPKSEGVVTFEEIEAVAVDGGLDWPTQDSARMSDEDWDDYDPQSEFGFYGNEYGGYGRGGGGKRRPVRPPHVKPKPLPEPAPAQKDVSTEKTPAPDVGPVDRRRAKSAPSRPRRDAGARTPPKNPRK